MTLSQLRTLTRGMTPGAKLSVINNTTLDLILNEGVKDVALYSICLKANKKFDVVADKYEYNLSTVIGDYLTVDKPGLWWYNSTKWMPVYPKTLKWLDTFKPGWRDLSSGSPREYSIDADILTVSPPPTDAGTEYFWLYYGKKPAVMTQNTHYPFSGSTTEFTHLSIFDFAIILFAKWKLEPMLNKKADATDSMQKYMIEREEKTNLFYRRKDIAHSDQARMSGPSIGR